MRLLLLSLVLAACSGPAAPPDIAIEEPEGVPLAPLVDDELALARAKWADADLQSYELTIGRSCECLPEAMGPFTVSVEGGETTSVLFEGRPAAAVPPTVEELFGMLEKAYAQGAARVEAEYHADWGYPTRLFIDWEEMIADEEDRYWIPELIRR